MPGRTTIRPPSTKLEENTLQRLNIVAKGGQHVALLAAIAMLFGCRIQAAPATQTGYGNPDGANRYGGPPAVVQLHSPPLYRSFVTRSVPYRELAKQTRNAAIKSKLRVREVDTIFDDFYERDGTIVMLGMEDGALVGFTTRYSVDILYPDDDLISDAGGKPDFRDRELLISPPKTKCAPRGRRWCTLRYALVRAPEGRLRLPNSTTAYFRTFGDNDAVLVYFPPQMAERLAEASIVPADIGRPSVEVARALSDASKILGKDFVLVSPQSLRLLRQKAHAKSVIATYAPEVLSWAAGLVGASRIIKALMSKSMGYFALDRTKLQAALTYKLAAEFAAQTIVNDFDFHRSITPAGDGQTYLPPLHLADVPYERAEDAAAFMQQIVGSADVELVLFGQNPRSAQNGMLFVPARHVNLNYELVRSGLARLSVDPASREALRLFPEFADAASQALAEGAGFTAEWRTDRAYVNAVEQARAGHL